MRVYKYVVEKDGPGIGYGFLCVVVAESREAADTLAREYCAENGYREIWLEIAKVVIFDINEPAVVGWAVAK